MKKLLSVLAFAVSMVLVSCSPESKLQIAVGAASAECPIAMDEATSCVDILIEGKNVVYKCVIDETKLGIELTELNFNSTEFKKYQKALLKEVLTSNTNSDEISEFFNLCKEAKYNIVCQYIGSDSGCKYDVTINYYEL